MDVFVISDGHHQHSFNVFRGRKRLGDMLASTIVINVK